MRKLFVFTLLICSLFLISCGGKEASNFKKALYYTDIGRYNDAIKLYTTILRSNPESFAAHSNRALVYEHIASKNIKERDKYLDLAEKDYIAALKIKNDMPEVLNNLGALYIAKRKFYDAILYLDVAVNKAPNYYSALVNRGIANYNVGRGLAAYNDFHKAIELRPRNYLAYFNRGLYYYDIGDYLNAAMDQTMAIQFHPNFGRAYLERGRALKMEDAYADALNDFEVAVYLSPQDAVARYYLGEMLYKNHQYEEAIAELLKSKELDPGFIPTYELMGDILAVEDPMASVANYVICKKLDPKNTSRYNYKIRRVITEDGRKQIALSRFL